jgi:hypothetical protein
MDDRTKLELLEEKPLTAVTSSMIFLSKTRELAGKDATNELPRCMNTASKLGPHTQTDRGTCPGVGL